METESLARFSPAEREAIVEILEECEDSLAIYQSTLGRPTMTVDAADAPPEIGISGTSVAQSLSGDDAADMTDSRREVAREAVREKLRQDSLYVSNIIRELKREIREHGTMEVLIGEIETITSRQKQERLLLEERERMEAMVAELRKAIADKKSSSRQEQERLTRKLTSTRDEKERLKLIKDAEMRYVRAWEEARREQNALRRELKMKELTRTLEDREARVREENRVHGELTRYLTQRITLIESRIEEWRLRYDREREMYEKKIREVRNEIEDTRSDLEKLTTEYRSNQEFIDTYLAEQEALRRQKEHEDHVQRSAIRIQAWWRGVMVRRKLGPYRPEEKKKKRAVKTKK